ncbi:hypothetical protein [Mycobacterium sp. IDR2000157661]|uniref:hypothetical protein n=1 Tax=Mycobacterium sp. IDR2000157661 TaxID=2867005 RepID=UPI001EEC968E|nr:hypothetical protein [Mycobacterium sp. IDR2000157661]ULE33326.1 hypothetical protein K3G64_00950 [Mycobacterium sp. IDR2000157661]
MNTQQWAQIGMGVAGVFLLAVIAAVYVDGRRDVMKPPQSVWNLLGTFFAVFLGGCAVTAAAVLL